MRGMTNTYYVITENNSSVNTEIIENDISVSNGLNYQFYSDGNGDWELAILTSGTITFDTDVACTIFMVGGGKNGATGTTSDIWQSGGTLLGYQNTGGTGGAGGQIIQKTTLLTKNTPYTIVIGDNSNNTSGFGFVAISGGGCSGGRGARTTYNGRDGSYTIQTGTSSNIYAFGTQGISHFYPNIQFGAGGGGGHAAGYNSQGYYNVPGVAGGGDSQSGANGGSTGGGQGGGYSSWTPTVGSPGTTNYGAGGGGGGAAGQGNVRAGGAGGTGIILLKPAYSTYLIQDGEMQNIAIAPTSYGIIEKNSNGNSIDFKTDGNYASIFHTVGPIDLTNYSKMKIELDTGCKSYYNANGCPGIHISSTMPTITLSNGAMSGIEYSTQFISSTSSSFGGTVYTLDFSSDNLTGNYYLTACVSGTSSYNGCLYVKNWWLEM